MVEDPAPSLVDLEYDQRRRILVVGQRVVEAVEAAHEASKLNNSFFNSLPGGADDDLKRTVKAIVELRRKGRLLPVSPQEAKALSFPPGHPEEGSVYAGNPVVAEKYYPLDSFHRQTFEHKFREAVNLLIGLGPTRLSVYCQQGWGKSFALGFEVPEVGQGKFGFSNLKMSKALFQGKFRSHPPRRPVGGAWFPYEPAWETMVDARLNGETEQLNLMLEYSDDYGITAGFASQVDGSPFEVGGKFTSFTRTVWRFQVDFRPSLLEKLGLTGAGPGKAAELKEAAVEEADA